LKEPESGGHSRSDTAKKRREELEGRLRLISGALGFAVLVSGVVAAFLSKEGLATASLLAAGFALLFLGYLGPYITKIKFGDLEAELERFHEKAVQTLSTVDERAAQTLSTLDEVARSYESIRASMEPGGERTQQMEEVLWTAEQLARAGKISSNEIAQAFRTNEKGKRIWVLGAMKGDPELRDFEIVLQAIEDPHAGFDQDRFLLLAGEMLPTLGVRDRRRLREAIERQKGPGGEIKKGRARWLTAQHLIALLNELEGKPADPT
jgi:hypothetical protein